MAKNINYRRVDKLRTRQRDSAILKTAKTEYTKTGLKGGSLGVSYTDTAPSGDLDGFPDKITKTSRAQAVARSKGTVDRPYRLSTTLANAATRIAKSAPAAVKATFNNLFTDTTPTTGLKTQAGDFLTTEAGDFLVQE